MVAVNDEDYLEDKYYGMKRISELDPLEDLEQENIET